MLAHDHGQVWNSSEFARSFGVTDKTVRHDLDLLRRHENNELESNPSSHLGFGAKVARCHHSTQRAESGSPPAACTSVSHLIQIGYLDFVVTAFAC